MSTFALASRKEVGTHNHWRDGRVVDYNGLENRRTERYRGFESLSLRRKCVTRCKSTSCAFCLEKAGRLTDGFC